jgi:hypothetical protein
MHVATAGPEQMKVERFTLTLTKGADGKWSITKEDLQDTFDKMWRTTVSEAPFYSFDSVAFEREGLKVTGGAGTLYKIQLNKADVSYVASAANLAFEYAPPADVPGHMRALHGVIVKKFPDDFGFPIQEVSLSCSPQACKELESKLGTATRGARRSGGSRSARALRGGARRRDSTVIVLSARARGAAARRKPVDLAAGPLS